MPYFQYLDQFLIIAVAHILAVVSPGPDFFLVVRQSFLYGRKKTILTSLGIASGILIHTSYCSLGLSFILSHEFIYNALKILCAIYLFYLGFKSVLSKPDKNIFDNQNIKDNNFNNSITSFSAYKQGFITNTFNANIDYITFLIFLFGVYPAPLINMIKYFLFHTNLFHFQITPKYFIT